MKDVMRKTAMQLLKKDFVMIGKEMDGKYSQ